MAKVAILGLGTVGSGVAEVLTKNADSIARKAGEPVAVKYILGRHNYPDSPFRDLVVTDFSIIEKIAEDLPMSRRRRPQWDFEQLISLGFDDIHVKLHGNNCSSSRNVKDGGLILHP